MCCMYDLLPIVITGKHEIQFSKSLSIIFSREIFYSHIAHNYTFIIQIPVKFLHPQN